MNAQAVPDMNIHILDLLSDDWYGLWEVDWEFNKYEPVLTPGDRISVIVDLLRDGLVELRFAKLDQMRETGPIAPSDAVLIVGEYRNWQATDDPHKYTLTETPAGKEVRDQWWRDRR